MYWTNDHDTLLSREILALDPFDTKKGTPMRGDKWKQIADNLMTISNPKFKVDTRSVRDRYRTLSQKLKRKLNNEKKASGIETDMTECETALEELLEKEKESDALHEEEKEGKTKAKEEEKKTAEQMRTKAMEGMGKRKCISLDDDDEVQAIPKKRRSNGNDTLAYLRERSESLESVKIKEMEIKKREVELQEKKHDDFMKMMMMQQQQQTKQLQDFQMAMMTMLAKMNQK